MKIFKLSMLIAVMSVLATFANHTNAAVRFKVVQGASCAAAEAAIPITTTGGTVAASVCVVTTAAEFVCSATYPIVGSAAPATTAGVQIASLTLDPAFPNRLDITALPQTITASTTNVQLANGVALAGVQVGGAGPNVKIADISFTVPAGLPAGTTFTYTVSSTGQIETRNIASTNCNDLNSDRVSNGSGTQTFSLVTPAAPVATAPTASLAAVPTLTIAGATANGSQGVNVLTPGSLTGSLALSCSVAANTASIAITSNATQTINAGATTALAMGLSCTPQAAQVTAVLSCAQTATPGPNPANLTSTITCPAAVPASITYTAAPLALTFTGITAGTPTATQSTTVTAAAGNTAALNLSGCTFGGANAAEFSFNPVPTFPVSVAAGASTALPVRFTPSAANSAVRTATLTCTTPNATAAGAGSFVVNLTGNNPTATAPTASLAAGPTLTTSGSTTTGSQSVNVPTPGSNGGSLALSCSVAANTASIAITSNATQTINAGATTALAMGLSCTPQAAQVTAVLSCAQTATPGPNPANLTSTITCPAAVPASITYTAAPLALTFTGITAGTPTATQSTTVTAAAGNTAALNLSGCTFGGANAAEFSFNPVPTFPVSVAAGASTALPVRFTPSAANSAVRTATLTCTTPNATAAGAGSFVVNLTGNSPATVVTAVTPSGAVTLPPFSLGTASSSTPLSFNVTGGPAALACTATGVGYTATPNPLNLVVGTPGVVTVTYTGSTVGTFTGSLNCTSASGGPFAYALSTTVNGAPPVTAIVPTMDLLGLGLMSLMLAGLAGFQQRRRTLK